MESNETEKTEKAVDLIVVRPFTEAQIEEHAAKIGGRRNVQEIPITTDDGYQFVYLVKRPSKNLMQAIAVEENKKEKSDVTALQKMMLGCVLEGDADAYENDGAIYVELIKGIGNLVKTAKVALKKN